MKQQSSESQKEIQKLLSIFEKQQNNNHEVFIAKILEESIQEYRQAGTPVRVLDSYDSLTNEEKADLYDKVMLRVKGRLGKSNKYKTNKTSQQNNPADGSTRSFASLNRLYFDKLSTTLTTADFGVMLKKYNKIRVFGFTLSGPTGRIGCLLFGLLAHRTLATIKKIR